MTAEPAKSPPPTPEETGPTLGLRVAVATVVLVLVLFGLYWGGRRLLVRPDEISTDDPASTPGTPVTCTNTTVYRSINEALNQSPEEVCILDLSHQNLTALPEEVGRLWYLQELNASHNQLTSFQVGYLWYLKRLNLSSNQLTSLPPEIAYLGQLQELDVSANQLQSLPTQIAFLASLEQFNVSNNQLLTLPQQVAFVGSPNENLKVFNVRDNSLRLLPNHIRWMENLQEFDLSNNPLPAEEIREAQQLLPHAKIIYE